jgi:hypothetical protein
VDWELAGRLLPVISHRDIDAGSRAKGKAACIARATTHCERMWADVFHDRALRKDDDVLTAARCIVVNDESFGLYS